MTRATVSADGETITVHIPMTFRKRGGRKLVVTPDGAAWAPRPRVDNAMVKALARAFRWRKMLDTGVHATLDDLARAKGVAPSYVSRPSAVLSLDFPTHPTNTRRVPQGEESMLDEALDAAVVAVLDRLNDAMDAKDAAAVAALFEADGYWRDLVAFTWNIRTMQGRDEIAAMLAAQLPAIRPRGFTITPGEAAEDGGGFQQAWVDFETEAGRGHGHIRIREGTIWTLLTTLKELKGAEEPRGPTRPKGVAHGAFQDRKSWAETRAEEAASLGFETQPYALIVGGGQGGIALGARLRQLDVPTIVVEKNARAGDSWRKRYKSLCLHDPVWYDHLPYLPFPANWPVFSPKDKIGDWLEMYTRVMELNYWTNTTCESARWDEAKQEWEVRGRRDGEEIVVRPKQLVLATGMSGKPNVPKFPGQDDLQGRAAPLVAAPGSRCLEGQAGSRDRVEQLGPRHRRGALGGGRGRDHGAAVVHPHRAVRAADGEPRRAVFRAGGGQRRDHRQGRPDLRLDPLPVAAGVPETGLRQDPRGRCGVLSPGWRRRASCSTGARTTPGSS